MPILPRVGARRPGPLAARGVVYLCLSLGALAIVYPLLIVVGQTLSDSFDLRDNAIVPRYLRDRNDLLLKHIIATKRNVQLIASRHHRNDWRNADAMRADTGFYASRPAALTEMGFNFDAWETVLADWNAFKATLRADEFLVADFRVEDDYRPFLRTRYRQQAARFRQAMEQGAPPPLWFPRTFPDPAVRKRMLADPKRLAVAIMNHELQSDYNNMFGVEVVREGNFLAPFWRPGALPKDVMWSDFKASLPGQRRFVVGADTYWHTFLRIAYRDVKGVNAAWGTAYAGIPEIRFPRRPPAAPRIRKDWDRFVVLRWPRRMLSIPAAVADAWRGHVRGQLRKRFESAPDADAQALAEAGRLTNRRLASWAEFPFFPRLPEDETLGRYWCEFTVSGAIAATNMTLITPRIRLHEFLADKYGVGQPEAALTRLNAAWQTAFTTWDEIPLPFLIADYAPVHVHPWRYRVSFMTEAYERVAAYMFGRGRAAWNTLVLVLLALASALTINPCAAYALSRFPMKHSSKILVFFLATMAFPAEVAMIPNFLLLRDLGLLNTFAALVLPGMANGYAIFLLKGFFDSLPEELYHAAAIDGASELQVFRMVAVPLVKPILAYIGLNAFVMAYSSFMWAFVICPKPEMWTLMVWVYDFQSRNAGNNYVLAATALVCIPPLIVFLFANRIIMKGIVIPSMK
jgi:ABC-type glycerol-3-phosphate transport system permease component